MADHHYIKSLFFKFLSDECTSTEIDEIVNYLKASKNIDALPRIEEVKAKLGSLPKLDGQRADIIFNNVISHEELATSRSHSRLRTIRWQIAASFIGFLLLSGILLLYTRQDQNLHYATHFGETKKISLSDGTQVTLNANSELQVPEHWEESDAREVWLEGEAFFSVVHTHDHRDFVVHTSYELSVEVLGTQFNVNSRDKKATVVLNSGKVKVQAKKEGVAAQWIMQPGDLIEYEHENQQINQKSVDTTLYTSWRNNLLLFKDTSLEEIALVIKDNYGFHVTFEDESLAKLHFTGANPADKLDLLLKTLAMSFNLEVSVEGKQIIVKKK